jgi:predicted amidohydrolase YtcJ
MSRAAMDGFQVAVTPSAMPPTPSCSRDRRDRRHLQGDRRWRIEHAQIVDPADLAALRPARHDRLDAAVHQTCDWRMAERGWGWSGSAAPTPGAAMLAAGVPLAFGSDFPVEHPNPFHGLAAAISREDPQNQPPGGWMPEQKLTVEQACAASPWRRRMPASPRTGSDA